MIFFNFFFKLNERSTKFSEISWKLYELKLSSSQLFSSKLNRSFVTFRKQNVHFRLTNDEFLSRKSSQDGYLVEFYNNCLHSIKLYLYLCPVYLPCPMKSVQIVSSLTAIYFPTALQRERFHSVFTQEVVSKYCGD